MSTLTLLEVDIQKLTPEIIEEGKNLQKKEDDCDKSSGKSLHPNLDLEQGKNLPEYLQGDVPDDCRCYPLKDPDPYYEDKETYIILDENYSIYRFTTTKSLFIFGPLGIIRKTSNKIFVHSIIMFTILVNCAFMVIDPDKQSVKDAIENYVENIFLGIYTFEMLVKVSSRGLFIRSFTYIRDPWNILDMLVIISAYADILILQFASAENTIPGMAALRAFRVLRALKAISAIPGLKAIVSALIESVKALKDVMILTLFCLSVFALIGLQLFMGSLRNKCVVSWPPSQNLSEIGSEITIKYNPNLLTSQFAFKIPGEDLIPYVNYTELKDTVYKDKEGYLVSLPMFCGEMPERNNCPSKRIYNGENETTWYKNKCNWCYINDAPWICGKGSSAGRCQEGYECQEIGINPNHGYTSFDTFLAALLSLFRLLAQDFWENLYQITLRANGKIYLLFFMLVIFLGSFYLINLILAVVAMAYDEQHQIIAAEEDRKRLMMQRKKEQLEAIIEDITNREDQLQSRRMSHATDATGGFVGGYNSSSSSPRTLSVCSVKRRSDGHQHKVMLKKAEENPTTPVIEINNGSREAGSYGDINVRPINHPHGILRNSPAPSIRGSCRNLGILQNDERLGRRAFMEESDEAKGSLTSLLDGKKLENLEFSGICDLHHENTIHFDDERVPNREDHIQMSVRSTVVDQNGIVSLVPTDNYTHRALSSNNVQRQSYGGESSRQNIDYLLPTPSAQRSRLSISIEHLTEPELAKLKQRAMSQASIMIEGMEKSPEQSAFYRIKEKLCIWECFPGWIRLQRFMKKICDDCFFDLFITLCIVVNTICLALERKPDNVKRKNTLEDMNTVLSYIFIGELIIKMIGMHPFYYFKEKWNCFDFAIVSVSILEMSFADVKGLSGLRSFRLMRVFKLAKSWPTLNMLIKIIVNSIGSLGNLTLILLILLFIFAVIGKELFRKAYIEFEEQQNKPLRWHMKDFIHSFLIVFRILCGEWIQTMWDCMRIAGSGLGTVCVPVFLTVQIVGNLVVLNLFLALLLSSFTGNLDDPDGDPPLIQQCIIRIRRFMHRVNKHFRGKRRTLLKCWRRELTHPNSVKGESSPAELSNENQKEKYLGETNISNDTVTLVAIPNDLEEIQVPKATAESDFGREFSDDDSDHVSSHAQDSSIYGSDSSISTTSSISNSEYERQQVEIKRQGDKAKAEEENLNEPAACCPLVCRTRFKFLRIEPEDGFHRMWWNARKISYRIIEHSWFETFIILMILLSSAALAFEDVYFHHKPTLQRVLKYADRIFTYIFIFEMLLKWLGYGLKKYFTNAWCILDFAIVAVSIVSLITDALGATNIPGIRSLRTLRALRPLRALSRFQGMKVVVNALMGAIPSIFNVLMVCLIFWLIFSIMGVTFFGGKFWKCKNITSGEKLKPYNETVGGVFFPVVTNETCENMTILSGGEIQWVNSKITFDNSFDGYLALLQVATFKGWMEIMEDAVDMTGEGKQPSFENFLPAYIYFIAFIVFGSFCTLNLFIGVIIDNFNQQKKKLGGQDIFMTEEQRKYYNAMKKLGSKKPQKPVPRPKNKCQAWVFDIVTHQIFEITIMLLIVANMVTMMIEFHNMSERFKNVLEYINYVFVAIFCGEASIKLVALRHHYFTNAWNVFDFVVVIFSIIGSALNDLINKYLVQPTLFRIIRLARIGRILRLIKGAKGIRTLLFALMMSLPALVNIGLLLILVMFIYSIFGMSQFAYVKRYSGVDDLYNFETFTNSFICLFMITTSAGWDGLLNPLLNSEAPDCDENLKIGPNEISNCGSPTIGVAFFVTYLILTFLIVVNMYIAIILENFGVATEESTDPLGEEDFEMFYEVWERFDPKATQFIAYSQLSDMVDSLQPPLRVPKPNNRQLVAMDLPMVYGDRLHCLDILFALTKRVLGESEELEGLRSQMEEKFMASNPSKVSYEPITTTLWRKQEELSAVRIQRWWRSFKFRRTIYAVSNLGIMQSASSDDLQPNGRTLNQIQANHSAEQSPGCNDNSVVLVDCHVDLNGVLVDEQQVNGKNDDQHQSNGSNASGKNAKSASITDVSWKH